jgi:hypothetical protein
VGCLVLAHDGPQGILKLHLLDEEVVLRVELGQGHRALEVERELPMDAPHPRPLRQTQKEREVQDYGGREDRIPRLEIYL